MRLFVSGDGSAAHVSYVLYVLHLNNHILSISGTNISRCDPSCKDKPDAHDEMNFFPCSIMPSGICKKESRWRAGSCRSSNRDKEIRLRERRVRLPAGVDPSKRS